MKQVSMAMKKTETLHPEQLDLLARDIQSLWEERRGGEFLRVKDRLSEICLRFSLKFNDSPGSCWTNLEARGLPNNLVLDILVLRASLLHGASEHKSARMMLDEIDGLAKSKNCFKHYHLEFELGLADGISGKYHNAIRHWQCARGIRHDPLSKAFCDVNIALAQEYLGFVGEEVVENLVKVSNTLRLNSSGSSIVEQVDALIIRLMMREGNIQKIFDFAASCPLYGEAAFQVLFVSELPWLNSTLIPSVRDDLRTHLALNLSRYSNEYRFNTIQGIEEQSSSTNPRMHDQIQRLYLWIWRWLASGDLRALTSVQHLLNNMIPSITSKNLSTVEYGYANLALGWLCLFANLSRDYWSGLASSLLASSQNSNVLIQFELLFLEYLFATRDHQPELSKRTLLSLQSHQAFIKVDSMFPKIMGALQRSDTAIERQGLQDFFDEIRLMNHADITVKNTENAIFVDVLSGKITIDHKTLVNELAARTIAIMYAPKVMLVQDFANTCLGIRRFDPSRHDGYLAKALTAINKILGDAGRFSRRQDAVRFESTRAFVIVRFGKRTRQIQQLGLTDALASIHRKAAGRSHSQAQHALSNVPPGVSESVSVPKDNALVSASELAVAWNCSKVTVNRRIASLIEDGAIERVGRGPATKYLVPASLLVRS